MKSLSKFASFASIASLLLNITLHLATFIPAIPVKPYWGIPAIICTVCAFLPTLVLVMLQLPPSEARDGDSLLVTWRNSKRRQNDFMKRVLAAIPWSWRGVYIGACIYLFFNIVMGYLLTEGGSPINEDGNYILMDHGQVIRSITAIEYARFQAVEVRLFTALLMWLSLISVTGALVAYPKLEARTTTDLNGSQQY